MSVQDELHCELLSFTLTILFRGRTMKEAALSHDSKPFILLGELVPYLSIKVKALICPLDVHRNSSTQSNCVHDIPSKNNAWRIS